MIALGFDRVYQASKRVIMNVSSTNSAANTLNMIGGSAVEQQPMSCGGVPRCTCGAPRAHAWRLKLESSKRSKRPPSTKEAGSVGVRLPKRLPSFHGTLIVPRSGIASAGTRGLFRLFECSVPGAGCQMVIWFTPPTFVELHQVNECVVVRYRI